MVDVSRETKWLSSASTKKGVSMQGKGEERGDKREKKSNPGTEIQEWRWQAVFLSSPGL